ncbi:hypothetical protein RIF29_32999 [Crotalaria pallida]|uniref:Uncharacterized protein n=1 Tax=Crotalaria pallida TaxID=3830 RepID=A0AAN9ED68_CROPI
MSSAIASAAALVASHCIEIAGDMGAYDQIITVVNSAINAKTNGDIMTLTSGAATGIRTLNIHNTGALHWKQVSFNVDSNLQIQSMESAVISQLGPKGRRNISSEKTADKIIEFECESKGDRQFWPEEIQYMLNYRSKVA